MPDMLLIESAVNCINKNRSIGFENYRETVIGFIQ